MKNKRLIFSVALVIVTFVIYRQTRPIMDVRRGAPLKGGSDLVLQVRSIPVIHNLALGEFVIPAKAIHEVRIPMQESGMRNARLSGHFSASGSEVQIML